MNNRYIQRRRFLKASAFALGGYTVTSLDVLHSWATQSQPIDAIVIGSGFGGAVAALWLAQAGVQTLVLERGRRWTLTEEQNTFSSVRAPDSRSFWLNSSSVPVLGVFKPAAIDDCTGVLEVLGENGIGVLAGAGVGGGSLVYSAATYEPTRANFDRVFQGAISYDEMAEVYYPRVRSILKPSPIPEDILASDYYRLTRITLEQAANAGLPGKLLDMNLDWDVVRQEISGERVPSAIVGEFLYGNNSGCKNSLDRNYLLQAEQSGFVQILPLHVVTDIYELPENRYAVICNQIDEGGNVLQKHTFTSKHVFLAAGSMGTSKLLVKAKAKGTLPKLNDAVGKFWGSNGDTLGLRVGLPPTNPSQGGPLSAVIEDHANPIAPTALQPYPKWNETRQDYLYSLGFTIGSAKGSFQFDPFTNSVRLTWPIYDPEIIQLRQATLKTYQKLNQANTNSTYQPKTARVLDEITLHPLGGAVLGRACDFYGRVKGYKGLYVVDGAMIPGYTACANPSLTIAALAERCIERIIADDFV
ncbi:MAG: GMC family oxidoreductase [Chlorogloeopsis fritschii C42_A2020_084]|uniref:GMC oxidoreductase n=1 Tax=Chlorogloeopsis fritschii TaxID=1124 RepID=UPI001A01672F|nr:GMC oxidoreductase [Chlorogloeopsis fritschii]MBF2004776.1 GMC family oxidoreductase [Chlorogloeopsis fritschii C42_A2020_084]